MPRVVTFGENGIESSVCCVVASQVTRVAMGLIKKPTKISCTPQRSVLGYKFELMGNARAMSKPKKGATRVRTWVNGKHLEIRIRCDSHYTIAPRYVGPRNETHHP